MLWVEIIGWIGSTLYLVSYFLLAYQFIERAKFYYVLNIVAGLLAALLSAYKTTWQTVFLNLFWVFISSLAYYNRSLKIPLMSPKAFNNSIAIGVIISLVFFAFKEYGVGLDILAWTSVYLFIFSYYLLNMGRISLQEFNLHNFIGAVIIIPKMYVYKNYQVTSIQLIWVFIALYAYYRGTKKQTES